LAALFLQASEHGTFDAIMALTEGRWTNYESAANLVGMKTKYLDCLSDTKLISFLFDVNLSSKTLRYENNSSLLDMMKNL